MQWNISYDICALFILVLFCCYTLTSKRFKTQLNRIYDIMCLVMIGVILLDIVTVILDSYIDLVTRYSVYVGRISYVVLSMTLAVGLYWYTMELAGSSDRARILKLIDSIPFVLGTALTISSPWTKLSFYIDQENQFHQGKFVWMIYLLITYYIVGSFLYLVRYRRKATRKSWFAFLCFYVVLLVALATQMFVPELLLTGMAGVIGIISLYFAQMNPQFGIDVASDLLNRDAFYMEISTMIQEKREFSVVAFEVDDFQGLKMMKGENVTKALIHQVVDFLSEIVNAKTCFSLGEGRFAILLNRDESVVLEDALTRYYYAPEIFVGNPSSNESDQDRIVLQALMERFDRPFLIMGEEYSLTAGICFLSYPEDATRADEVNDIVEASLQKAKEIGKGTFLYASEYIQTRESYIEELLEQTKEKEEQVHQSENARMIAEQSDLSKSRFIAKMAQEISTPVDEIIRLSTSLLEQDLGKTTKEEENLLHKENYEQHEEKIQAEIIKIQDKAKLLKTMFEDMIDFYGIGKTIEKFSLERFDTKNLIQSVIYATMEKLRKTELSLIVNIDRMVPKSLVGNEPHLRQVLTNLLNNAMTYTKTGSITLRFSWSLPEKSEKNDFLNYLFGEAMGVNNSFDSDGEDKASTMGFLRVNVIDTGCGIREEDMDKLFQAYARFGDRNIQFMEGSGLGLPLCKLLVERMGGELTVDSIFGMGSDFSVLLPLEIADDTPIASVENAQDKHCLIFVENRELQGILEANLYQLSVQNTCVSTGFEMETMLETKPFTHILIEQSKLSKVKELFAKQPNAKVIYAVGKAVEPSGEKDWIPLTYPISCFEMAKALNE